MATKRALVTGAAGFVGACLTENLVHEGCDVNVLLRGGPDKWRLKKIIKDLKVWDVDIRDEYGVTDAVGRIKPEYVFHLATYGAYSSQKETGKIIATNINGTINLVNACLKTDFISFINIGSSSEYGIKDKPMKETDMLGPIDTYGVSKAFTSQYCSMIARTQKRPLSTIRLFSPFGYYEEKSRLVPTVILSCLRGENPQLAFEGAARDFIFIEDVIDLIKTVSIKSTGDRIYNGGMGKQHTVGFITSIIIEESGADVSAMWGSVPKRENDSEKWEADMSLVKKKFYWEPRFSLREGVKKTIEWFKNNLDLYREL